jgi:hypothetical protein
LCICAASQPPLRDGQAWVAGDVITCCIDLTLGSDGGTVSYHRNGRVALTPGCQIGFTWNVLAVIN